MKNTHFARTFALLLASSSGLAYGQSYYKEAPLFSTAPGTEQSVNTIERFGPVGMAIELHQPAFTMVVGKIEDGSPAAATGKLKLGQIIESINGQTLKDIDPRILLGQLIAEAEAKDGIMKFMVKDNATAAANEARKRCIRPVPWLH